MAFLDFLRANETQEKQRTQQGGVKNHFFNFIDDTLDVAEGAPAKLAGVGRGVRDFGVAAIRTAPRTLATFGETALDKGQREAGTAVTRSAEALRQLPYAQRQKALQDNEGLALVLKNKGVTDPTDANLDNLKSSVKQRTESRSKEGLKAPNRAAEIILGTEPVQSYQTRREGSEQAIEHGAVGGKPLAKSLAEPLSFLGAGATVALDAPGVNVPKTIAKKVLATTKTAVKRRARNGLVEESAPLADATSSIGRAAAQPPDVALPEVPTKTPVLGGVEPVVPGEGFRQRGLLKTTQASDLPLPARQASRTVEPQTYEQLNIEATKDAARKRVATQFDEAKTTLDTKFSQGQWDDETSSLTLAMLEKGAKEGNSALVKDLLDKSSPLATKSGQANVLWRGVTNAYDPEGMVKFAQKVVDDANQNRGVLTKLTRGVAGKGEYTLDDATKAFIREQKTKTLGLPDGPEKDAIVKSIFEKINDRIPVGASEMFDAYRYQNLLSNPRTQARNIASNLFNTMITRPATLATRATTDWFGATLFGHQRQNYLKEVPEYYRGMFNSFGDAIEASKAAWKGEAPIGNPDLKSLQAFRSKKMPKVLRTVSDAMEAQDKFLSTLIASGEYAAQKSKGVADDIARKEANRVAEYSLFRSMTDPHNASGQGKLLTKMDQLTDVVTKVGQKHPAFRWFVPFVRTPMNVTKQMLEFSPLGLATLPGNTRKTEQLSKALAGTSLTMIGAKMALDGNTTWDAPKDEKERQLFYESGKRPYSIKVGGKWIPMIYTGPYALAFALPAAVKDANNDAPIDAGTMERVAAAAQNSAKFFSQQTYVQGISNVVSLISGEGDANLANSLGFTAGQSVPGQGLLRYVAGVIDPTFRKANGFTESIQKDIPGLSKGLEPYTQLSGEESKRNASDYLAPYTVGSPTGSEQDKAVKQANSEFLRTLSKTSKTRSKANGDINAALQERDYTKAQQIADSYNEKLKKSFEPWAKKYGQYDNEYLTGEYDAKKIRLNRSSIAQRRYSMLRKRQEERSLINA